MTADLSDNLLMQCVNKESDVCQNQRDKTKSHCSASGLMVKANLLMNFSK